MKRISIVGLVLVVTGCSTHQVKCHGALRPINEATATAAGSKQPTGKPATGKPPTGNQPGGSAAPSIPKDPQP
jgi:hypothetical protein